MLTIPIKALSLALESLPEIDSLLPPGSVNTFYKLQIVNSTLKCSGVGRGGLYAAYSSELDVDPNLTAEFLIPAADTKALIKNLDSNYYVSLEREFDNIRITTRCSSDDTQTLDSNLLPCFAGDVSEFRAPELPTELPLNTPASELAEAVSKAISFGDYGNRTMGDRAVLVECASTLNIYALALNAPNYYYRQSVNLLQPSKTRECVALLGMDLELLAQSKTDAKSIDFNIEGTRVATLTNSRLVVARTQSLDRYAALKGVAASFEGLNNAEVLIKVSVSSKRLLEALTAQQPKTSPNKYVRLSFSKDELKISKAADLLTREFSLVSYFQTQTLTELTFNTSSAALTKTIKTLDRAISKSKSGLPLDIEICQLNGRYAGRFLAEQITDEVVCSLNLENNAT